MEYATNILRLLETRLYQLCDSFLAVRIQSQRDEEEESDFRDLDRRCSGVARSAQDKGNAIISLFSLTLSLRVSNVHSTETQPVCCSTRVTHLFLFLSFFASVVFRVCLVVTSTRSEEGLAGR